ncbi:MAG: hypothetical protein HC852_23675 [Acaryochloridaceae cyanobacterium RU_4_10]|nr:hypothetical protein [Acaryochloridaceae cyanobacterium RU_4_10]
MSKDRFKGQVRLAKDYEFALGFLLWELRHHIVNSVELIWAGTRESGPIIGLYLLYKKLQKFFQFNSFLLKRCRCRNSLLFLLHTIANLAQVLTQNNLVHQGTTKNTMVSCLIPASISQKRR